MTSQAKWKPGDKVRLKFPSGGYNEGTACMVLRVLTDCVYVDMKGHFQERDAIPVTPDGIEAAS